MTSPNDVFVLRNVDSANASQLKVDQLTHFAAEGLKGKDLAVGEDFWFDGAKGKVHGWTLKPPGFKEGEKKKWPVLLLIHGGKSDDPRCYRALTVFSTCDRSRGCLGGPVVDQVESKWWVTSDVTDKMLRFD